MHIEIFIKQLKRSKKTVFYLLLLLAATIFFVTSVNLYQNNINNLKAVEENFKTLAIMELKGDIDKYGNLVEKNSEEHIGNKAVGVVGYDFSDIVASEHVSSWDLRSQYGAYIEGNPALYYAPGEVGGQIERDLWVMKNENVIRFKTGIDKPYHLNRNDEVPGLNAFFEVLDSAADCYEYGIHFTYNDFMKDEYWESYAEEIKKLNGTDDTDKIILYPDVEYIAITRGGNWEWTDEPGKLKTSDSNWNYSNFDLYSPKSEYRNIRVTYDQDKERTEYEDALSRGLPFPLQRWEDVQNDPELKAYFDKAWDTVKVQQYVHNVQTTNDFALIPAYHLGGVHIEEGRLITKEEYENGANVCLISDETAKDQLWEIGDKLKMKLFENDYISATGRIRQTIYYGDETEFVHEAEYEIVGIYSVNSTVGNSEISANAMDLLTDNIFIPTKSLSQQRDLSKVTVHGSTMSIRLKNGHDYDFLDEMAAKGITEVKPGQYTPSFFVDDQGYSIMQASLKSMNSTSALLLILSTILLIIVCLLVAYFFWQGQRHTVGIFRMLGGSKVKAILAVLLCTMILYGISVGAGGLTGYVLSDFVGGSIIEESISDIDEDSQNELLKDSEKNELIRVKGDFVVTLKACGAVLLFPLATLGLMAMDINKEPRELLPKGKQ